MRKADVLLDFLREEGFAPKVDDDGDIVFKREGQIGRASWWERV